MTKLLLSLHVLAAVLAVGPVTVAASMFPPALRRALGDSAASHEGDALTTLRTLHRICRVYAGIGLAVPVLGFATAIDMGVLGGIWLTVSILLTGAAAGVLALLILPAQDAALAAAGAPGSAPPAPARLAMLTGAFNLLWATVTVLMIVRPGSTTGA
ncbi:membrane protein [Streptomyces fumigatiscleroticus]|nr:membrane protein [Streptomyces fumigatiscleroticus]